MKKILGGLLLGLVPAVLILYFGISWYFSSIVVVFVPTNYAQDPTWNSELIEESIAPTESFELQNGDNLLVVDVFDNPADADCAVITVHGLGGVRSIVRLAGPMFYDLGCDLMTFDAPYQTNDLPLTYGARESEDLTFLIEWYSDHTGLPQSNIGIWSESYGGATTMIALPDHPDIPFVVVDSTYSSVYEQITEEGRRRYGALVNPFIPTAQFFAEQRGGFTFAEVQPAEIIRDLNMPILLIHSAQDGFVLPVHSERIYANANQDITELVITDWGAPHSRSISTDEVAYANIVYDFLREHAPDFATLPEN
ncbi:MAG: prolyl oligopeptidase family serine peptidase [Chloroflexota bacterium]